MTTAACTSLSLSLRGVCALALVGVDAQKHASLPPLWSFPLLPAGVRRGAHVFPHKRDDGNDEGMSDAATIGSHGTPYVQKEEEK